MLLCCYILLLLAFTILGVTLISYYTDKRQRQLHHQISTSEKYSTLSQTSYDEEDDNSLRTTDTHYGGGGGGNFKYKFPGAGKIEFGGGAGFDYKHGKKEDSDDDEEE